MRLRGVYGEADELDMGNSLANSSHSTSSSKHMPLCKHISFYWKAGTLKASIECS